jgi:LacI family transcriptional regulator
LITIKDIAHKANVSIGTVDRVLHGRGRVSKDTAEKILSIIKKTGYKTNIHGSNLSLKKNTHFGVIMPHPEQDSGYWDILRKGIEWAVHDLAAFRVQVHYFFFDKYSEDSFAKAGEQALQADISGLLITPVLPDASSVFVNSIPKEIPYVFVDATIPGTFPLSYIGQNSFQSGVCAAKLMQWLIRDSGDVIIVRMLPNDFHINERVQGFSSYFEKNNAITIHTFDAHGGMCDGDFVTLVNTIKKTVPNCGGFFVTNAETHCLAKALTATKNESKFVIGYDLVEENKRLLRTGAINIIISQKTRDQGYRGIYTLFRHIVLNEPAVQEFLMPIDIITSENLVFYQ